MLGSKPIPENYVEGTAETQGRLKEALGIQSARDGISTNGATFDFNKFVIGVDFEKAVGWCGGKAFQPAMVARR